MKRLLDLLTFSDRAKHTKKTHNQGKYQLIHPSTSTEESRRDQLRMGQNSSKTQKTSSVAEVYGGGNLIDWNENEEGVDWYTSMKTPKSHRHASNASKVDGKINIEDIPEEILDKPSYVKKMSRFIIQEHTWIYLAAMGFVIALGTLLMNVLVSSIVAFREVMLEKAAWGWGYFIFVIFCLTFSVIAVMATTFVSVHAAGSGIPEMKVILSDIVMNQYLNLRTLIAKSVGLISAYAGGLSIGKEGPNVHLAAIMANQLMRLKPFKSLRKNEFLKMQILSAACAVGVGVTFGAPVGGVLFSVEVTTTYYMVQNLWNAFFAAVCAAGTMKLMVGLTEDTPSFVLFHTNFQQTYHNFELFAYLLMGLLCGGLSLLFIRIVSRLHRYRIQIISGFWKRADVQVVLVALLTGLTRYPVTIMKIDQLQIISRFFSDSALFHDMENVDALSESVIGGLFFFIIIKFIITVVAIGLPIPCGLFTPVFALGAGFGRLFGELLVLMFPNVHIVPAAYAVVGAAAFASGTTRTVSTAVIVFELTGQLSHMIPVFIAVVASNAISAIWSVSIYDTLLRMKNLPHIIVPPSPFRRQPTMWQQSAAQMMNKETYHITPKYTYADILDIILSSKAVSFPVVDSDESMVLLGQVQRSELENMLEHAQDMMRLNVSPQTSLPQEKMNMWGAPYEIPSRFRSLSVVSVDSKRRRGSSMTVPPTDLMVPPRAKSINGTDSKIDSHAQHTTPHAHTDSLKPPLSSQFAYHSEQLPTEDTITITPEQQNGLTPQRAAASGNMDQSLLEPDGTEILSWTVPLDFGDGLKSLSDEVRLQIEELTAHKGKSGDQTGEKFHLHVDLSPFCIWGATPLTRIHFLFSMLPLSHMYVLEPGGHLIGVITRREFLGKHKKQIMHHFNMRKSRLGSIDAPKKKPTPSVQPQ